MRALLRQPARRDSLMGQVVAVNVLLVTLTIFVASVAAGLDLDVEEGRRQFLVLAWAIVLCLLVNILMLRRRFSPLERLIEGVESVDPARAASFDPPPAGGGSAEEVDRLATSFRGLLERIEAERRRSGRLVLRAQEEERRRVARDLHDEVNQALTAILLRLEAISQDAPPALGAELREVKGLAARAMDELLQLARQLRPAALDDHGLCAALRTQVARFEAHSGVSAHLEVSGDPERLGEDGQTVVYRVVQEALSNVAQHAAASQVDVRVAEGPDGCVELEVRDDGGGFPGGRRTGGLGLSGMVERARLVGGDVDVESRPGAGTTIRLRVP